MYLLSHRKVYYLTNVYLNIIILNVMKPYEKMYYLLYKYFKFQPITYLEMCVLFQVLLSTKIVLFAIAVI